MLVANRKLAIIRPILYCSPPLFGSENGAGNCLKTGKVTDDAEKTLETEGLFSLIDMIEDKEQSITQLLGNS
jgi:hypothetical protein